MNDHEPSDRQAHPCGVTASIRRAARIQRGAYLVTVGLLLGTARVAHAQPANDSFLQRRVIETTPARFTDSNRGATTEPSEPNHTGQPGTPSSASIWYTWRAPASGLVVIDLAGSGFNTALGLYEGKQLDALLIRGQNNDNGASNTSRVLAPVEGGTDYQIAVAGVAGATGDVEFSLRLVTQPEFETQPADLAVTAGETNSFSARVLGPAPLNYQWKFNAEDLPGRSGVSTLTNLTLTLTLTNITEAQEGAYWLEVSNDYGPANSRRAALTVRAEPKILEHPRNVSASDGQDASFSVIAVGRLPLSYQWQFNGVNLPGQTDPLLFLSNVQSNNAGTYRVIVGNNAGTATSSNAVLTVTGSAPIIRQQPRGETNIVGSTVNLAVVVDGSRPLTYQWFKNGSALSGQTASNLVFSSAQLTDSGRYSVRVQNNRGVATSQEATVLILLPPPNDDFLNRIAITDTNYPVLVDREDRYYNIGATREPSEPNHDGTPPVQSVWWSWRAPARGLATVAFTNTTFAPRLGVYTGDALPVLQDVLYRTPFFSSQLIWLTDPDVDYALAIDRAGAFPGFLGFTLNFTTNLAPPLIIKPPVDKTVQACETLTLEVVATNQPTNLRYPLSYQWHHNGVDIPGATNATYTVANVSILHAGTYGVRVTNYGGTTESATCRCEVKLGPKIVLEPSDLTLRLCASAPLRALAEGCPPIQYQWQFNGIDLFGATNSTLQLTNADIALEGLYSALITNPDGVATSRVAKVTIDRLPVILSDNSNNLTVRECSTNTFQLSVDLSCKPVTFQWFFNRTNPIAGATTNVLRLANIQTNQQGDYSVVVSNVYAGITSRVARMTVSALPIIPSNQPEDKRRIRLGDSFKLEVSPDSCTPMTYRWLFNGTTNFVGLTDLVTVTNVTIVGTNITATATNFLTATSLVQRPMIEGITSRELVFTQPATNLNGLYRVDVSNAAGTVTSRAATIEILVPPPNDYFINRITIPGTNTTVTGYDIIATRETNEPTHFTSQRWERSVWWTWTAPEDDGYLSVDLVGSTYDTLLALYTGSAIDSLKSIASDDNGGGNNTSRIIDVTILERTTVQIAVDGKSNSEGNVRLKLVFNADTNAPVFTNHPISVAVLPGGTARFNVAIARTPRVGFQWQFKGMNLPGQTNTTLVITNVQVSDEGAYTCVATNKYGVTVSQIGYLTTGAIIRGQVTDATNKRGIPYARVSVGDDLKEVFTLTDTNGNYELVGARLGSARAEFDADRYVVGLNTPVVFFNQSTLDAAILRGIATNYYKYEDRQFIVVPGTVVTNSFSMSPILLGGMRFVLNWGLNPADLDAHLKTPRFPATGLTYEIDYVRPYTNLVNAPPFAQLDVDERKSYGPETMTVFSFVDGTYAYFVQNPIANAQGDLTTSQATVKIYDNSGLIRIIDVPKTGSGRFWHVFNLDGASRNIQIVNRITNLPPSVADFRPEGPVVSLLSVRDAADRRDIALHSALSRAAFEWDFGEPGLTSTNVVPNPILYRTPGKKTVRLRMSAFVNASETNVSSVKIDFITVTNDSPRIQIVSPPVRRVVRLGVPLIITANATDSDGTVTTVTFFADGRRIGELAAPPFAINWTPTTEAEIVLTARATDNFGAIADATPVPILVRELTGDILIVRNFSDPEIEQMKELAEEVRCFNGFPPVVRILNREGLRFDLMNTFRTIIWNDLGSTNQPLTESEIGLFQQCYDFGISLYFIGEHLASVTPRMEAGARPKWTQLVHVTGTGEKLGPRMLSNSAPAGHHDILFSAYAEFASFNYGGNLDNAAADPTVDVLLKAGNSPVLAAYPSGELSTRGTRTVTQNYRVVDAGGSFADEIQRTRLFKSAVAWLLPCPECPQSDMQLHRLESLTAEPKTGQPITLKVTIRHSGACDPTGVAVTNFLPVGVRVVSAAPTNFLQEADRISFRFGRLPNGSETNITLNIATTVPGTFRIRSCVTANGPDVYPADNCRELVLEVVAGETIPPRLSVANQLGVMRIEVGGPLAEQHPLEYSTNLQTWFLFPGNPQTGAGSVFYLDPATLPFKAYRTRSP